MLAAAGASVDRFVMKISSTAPLLRTLRHAGAVHSRHRALMFALRALIVLAITFPLLLLADVLFHFSGNVRWGGSLAIILAVLAATLTALGIAIFSRPPLLRIARLLESRNPSLGSSLVNILQLEADASSPATPILTRQLAARAVRDAGESLSLSTLPPLAREPRLPRFALRAFSAPLLLLLTLLFGGPHVRNQWLRFADPHGDHPPFSLTALVITSPAPGAEILYGDSITIGATASGHQPRELFLTATPSSTPGGKPLTVPFFSRGDGTFVASLENIRHPLILVAHTADGASRSHRLPLNLILTPRIGPATLSLAPPEYTGLKPREMSWRFTALQALEGTRITFGLSSNRPLGPGTLTLETDSQPLSTLPLAPLPQAPPESASASLIATLSGRLSFLVRDTAGNPASEKPSAALTVTRDLPPSLVITSPDADSLIVENLRLPVIVDATDDYGISQLRLHIGVNDSFTALPPVILPPPGERRNRLEHSLDLAALGAKAGDSITIFAEAIDTRPDPQLARSSTRRLDVITEEDYNNHLRREADVAAISGKYEDLLNRYEKQFAEQHRIAESLANLAEKSAANPNDESLLAEFSRAYSDQMELNDALEASASEMENFGRDNPVYDFEEDLSEKLQKEATSIRQSVAANRQAAQAAIESAPPPPAPPTPEMIEDLANAASSQDQGLSEKAEANREEIAGPLEDLARLHELMKNFNLFEDLAAIQKDLAAQSKAYADKAELDASDRLSLSELGARQRALGAEIAALREKLEIDAQAASEKFPEASSSARSLADAIDSSNMPGLARQAAAEMLGANPSPAHDQALRLHREMDSLLEDGGAPGRQGVATGFDRALRLNRGMRPGDSFRQMMMSKNFRPLPGNANPGMMGSAMFHNQINLLGSETLMSGGIARLLQGKGAAGSSHSPGAPTARIDPPEDSANSLDSSRRTSTPGETSLLLQYENIADAYFRKLTSRK